MQINELKKLIKHKAYPRILIFTGTEYYVKQFYLKKMSENWVKTTDIDNSASSKLLNNIHYLIDGEALLNYKTSELTNLRNKLLTSKNYFVFYFDEAQEINSDITKEFKDYIVEFNKLNKRFLLNYFKDYDLSNDYLLDLVKRCDNNYTKVKSELEKIKHYKLQTNVSSDIAFHNLDKEGVLYRPIGDYIFDFSGAIMNGNKQDINAWLYRIKQTDENILTIISTLTKNFWELYIYLSYEKEPVIRDKYITKGKQWILSKYKNVYSLKEVERNLKILQSFEAEFKMGTISEDIMLDYLTICLIN